MFNLNLELEQLSHTALFLLSDMSPPPHLFPTSSQNIPDNCLCYLSIFYVHSFPYNLKG